MQPAFHILPTTDERSRHQYVCRLTEKAYRLEHSVFILVASESQGRVLDDLLWTFRQGSFVPHGYLSASSSPVLPPVLIGCAAIMPVDFCGVLINLGESAVPSPHRYARVIELVDEDTTLRARSRAHYRAYQASGLEPETCQVAIS